MRIENQEVIMSAEELNTILEFAVLNGCESCEFCTQCFFAADCITNDFKYYLEKKEREEKAIIRNIEINQTEREYCYLEGNEDIECTGIECYECDLCPDNEEDEEDKECPWEC